MQLNVFKGKSFVGLDLGHHMIKAAQVEKGAEGWKVTRLGSMPTPTDSIKDGIVVDHEAVALTIRALLKEAHMNATVANIAVAGGSVVVRSVRIPKMPEATLRKSIKYEASRYVPTSVEDSYVEFEILGEAEDNQMDILVVAAPKDIVESRMRAVEAAGLNVEAVDVEAFAAFRSLLEFSLDSSWLDQTVALVDIGATTTNLSVIRNGVFVMTRSIPHGSQVLTKALESYFKLSVDDAEAGKAQLDVTELLAEGGPKENPPLRVLQPHIDDLVREIRRSLNYYQSQQAEGAQNKAVDTILISGGGAKMQGLAQYVEHKLALSTKSAGIFDSPIFLFGGTEDPGSGHEFSVASGLAMRSGARAA